MATSKRATSDYPGRNGDSYTGSEVVRLLGIIVLIGVIVGGAVWGYLYLSRNGDEEQVAVTGSVEEGTNLPSDASQPAAGPESYEPSGESTSASTSEGSDDQGLTSSGTQMGDSAADMNETTSRWAEDSSIEKDTSSTTETETSEPSATGSISEETPLTEPSATGSAIEESPGTESPALEKQAKVKPSDEGTPLEKGAAGESSAVGATAQTVTVQPGDILVSIAKRVYGDPFKWRLIYEANRDKLPDPDRLQVGMKLIIPPLSDASN
jgi:Uncharacterized protein containing LysM domain